ncbi:MAG: MFS transporter, partial [Gaiellaceae bacterium]
MSVSPLRHRDFSFLVASMVAEAFALQMSFVAIGWQVYSVRGNALDLGLLGLAEFLPLLLLALPAGQLADRVPRRHLLAVMMLVNVVVLSGLLAVTLSDTGRVWPFFALAFVQGVG